MLVKYKIKYENNNFLFISLVQKELFSIFI